MDYDVTLKDIATCLGLIDRSYEHRIREDLEINRLPAAVVPEGVLVEAFDERLKMQRVVRSFPSPLPSTTSSSLTCSPPRILQVGALGSDALDDGRIFFLSLSSIELEPRRVPTSHHFPFGSRRPKSPTYFSPTFSKLTRSLRPTLGRIHGRAFF